MLICFIVVVPIMVVCLSLLLLARRTVRELPQRQIRPTVKRFIGLELPSKADNLRALFHSYRGVENVSLAFQTDQQGWSYILDAFAGKKHIHRHEFPQPENRPFQWGAWGAFLLSCSYQNQLRVRIFDEDLINRIGSDHLEYVNTGHYPKDAVTGYYLNGISGDPMSELVFYHILVFKDRGLVYIYAAKEA